MHGGRCVRGLDAKLPGKRPRRDARGGARRSRRLLLVEWSDDRHRLTTLGDPTEYLPLGLVSPSEAADLRNEGRSP
jgi:hypothetical protein